MRMPVRIRDERTERIQPPKVVSVVIGQAPRVSEADRRSSPWVRGIVLNRRQAQHRNAAPLSDAIKSVTLEKVMRIRFDKTGLGSAHMSRRHYGQGQRFEHEEIAPASGRRVARATASCKFDEHVMPVDEGSEFRTFTTGR